MVADDIVGLPQLSTLFVNAAAPGPVALVNLAEVMVTPLALAIQWLSLATAVFPTEPALAVVMAVENFTVTVIADVTDPEAAPSKCCAANAAGAATPNIANTTTATNTTRRTASSFRGARGPQPRDWASPIATADSTRHQI